MAMTRNDMESFIATRFHKLAHLANSTYEDDPSILAEIIDDALLTYRTAYSDLATAEVPDDDVEDMRWILRYQTYNFFSDQLVTLQDANRRSDGLQALASTQYPNILKKLKQAESEVKARGYDVGETQQFVLGRLNLDFLEPAEEAG